MRKPAANQVCVVEFQSRDGTTFREYAVWDTGYSLYGAGGHFVLADGGQLGLPVDVSRWWGTHWIATETPDIACSGQDTPDAP